MENPLSTVTNATKNGPIFKILLCGFLGLLLLIPASMIEELVSGRNQLKNAATEEISSKWGASTVLSGPVLTIPYQSQEDQVVNVNGVQTYRNIPKTKYLHVLPNDLAYETEVEPSVRSRGIYDVVVYRSKNTVRGSFDLKDLPSLFSKRGTPDFANATVTLGFSDSKGVESIGKLKFGNAESEFTPGSSIRGVLPNGTSSKVDLTSLSGSVAFSADVSIRGSEWIKYLPLGKSTNVKVSSAWANPSFDGAFLPTERNVTDKGFTAEWKILDYNRDFPQFWDDNAYSLGYVASGVAYAGGDSWDPYGNTRMMKYAETSVSDTAGVNSVNLGTSAFGVSLKQGIDSYDKTSRTIRYAILVIGLTFVAFFLMEVLHKMRIHPIQYLLVGFALVVFYTLTLSLSEHMSFDMAYLASAIMTVTLVTGYVGLAFRTKALTLTILSILSILYAFIYVILSSEDYALLLGSFGIFFVLALLMYATRDINWYAIGEKKEAAK